MPHRDTSVQYHRTNMRLYIQPGLTLNATQGHKHPIDIELTLRLEHKLYRSMPIIYRYNLSLYNSTRTQVLFQDKFDSMLQAQSHKLSMSIRNQLESMLKQLARSTLVLCKQIIKYNRWQQRNGSIIHDVTSVKYNNENEIFSHTTQKIPLFYNKISSLF